MDRSDVFLCYRRAGAQTAKLFKRFLEKHHFPGSVWYSDSEPTGNYKQDIPTLIREMECAVIFVDKYFTKDFLTYSDIECITSLEVIEIAKKLSSHPEVTLFTVFLDRHEGFTREESCVLEELFLCAGIEHPRETVLLFSQNNTVFFSTAVDDEEELFDSIFKKMLPNDYYRAHRSRGNFYFGVLPTYVDVLLWDDKEGIDPDNIYFSLDPKRIPLYEKIDRSRSSIEYEVQNNQMISVLGVDTVLSDNDERKIVDLRYKTIDYRAFYKTLMLWEQMGLDHVISSYDWRTDVYPIPNAMGLAFMVITSDHKMIFTMRSSARRIRPNEYDCSIVEGLKMEAKTKQNDPYTINDEGYLRNEILRSFQEEICGDSDHLTISVTGLVLDKQYGQWNFIGTIRTPYSSEQLHRLHAIRDDTYEDNDIYAVSFADEYGAPSLSVVKKQFPQYLRGKIWGMALAVTYTALRDVGFSTKDICELSSLLI